MRAPELAQAPPLTRWTCATPIPPPSRPRAAARPTCLRLTQATTLSASRRARPRPQPDAVPRRLGVRAPGHTQTPTVDV